MSRGRLVTVVAVASMALAACNQATPDGPAPATEEAPADQPVDGALPESGLVADLSQTYGVAPGGEPRQVDPTGLPAPAGTVQAHWYRGAARYVILFSGIDMTSAGGLCPGSSLESEGSFKAVNNSPTEEGACPEGYTIDEDAARVCGPLLMYLTQIHEDETGNLYSSIDKLAEDGGTSGMTGSVASNKEIAPEIDFEAASYVLPASLGGTEVTC